MPGEDANPAAVNAQGDIGKRKSNDPWPSAAAVRHILIWHQGALGDLLLAGPALEAISRRYPQARITGLGVPERWQLLAATLPLAQIWDSSASLYTALFVAESPLPPALYERLAAFRLAVVFTPRPPELLSKRLRQAGIPAVLWVPSFPVEETEPVTAVQARHLAALELNLNATAFRLVLPEVLTPDLDVILTGAGPWVAVAPGSGHPCKNWPLAHYHEVTRELAFQHGARVIWLSGPAEASWEPYLQGLARAQGHLLLARYPLPQVAAVLARCRLFLGGDSGLTHLAAALRGPEVLALFGPTDPRIWAPPGEQVQILRGPCSQAPCTSGRKIDCPRPHCLYELSPKVVLAAAVPLLGG